LEKPADRRAPLILERLRRHRQPRVVGQQRDDPLDVVPLEGVRSTSTARWRGGRCWSPATNASVTAPELIACIVSNDTIRA
jgi:hypothetical protein